MVKLVLRAFKGLGIYQDLPSFLPFFQAAYGILVPQPRIELVPLALEAWSLNHWTTRAFPRIFIS